MPHAPILVFGYSEAAMFLRGPTGPGVGAVISIAGAHSSWDGKEVGGTR